MPGSGCISLEKVKNDDKECELSNGLKSVGSMRFARLPD
jgi:hypothetical protein